MCVCAWVCITDWCVSLTSTCVCVCVLQVFGSGGTAAVQCRWGEGCVCLQCPAGQQPTKVRDTFFSNSLWLYPYFSLSLPLFRLLSYLPTLSSLYRSLPSHFSTFTICPSTLHSLTLSPPQSSVNRTAFFPYNVV